ncbi:hypothetical protein GZL_03674 [Streptomyces sp. 769]|nr:hypothetical protein GZL_03674 [Streptomyces sp. 769]
MVKSRWPRGWCGVEGKRRAATAKGQLPLSSRKFIAVEPGSANNARDKSGVAAGNRRRGPPDTELRGPPTCIDLSSAPWPPRSWALPPW